jgi:hypothetical protein
MPGIALQLDPDGEIIAMLSPFILAFPGMPSSIVSVDELMNQPLAFNEKMSGNLKVPNRGK